MDVNVNVDRCHIAVTRLKGIIVGLTNNGVDTRETGMDTLPLKGMTALFSNCIACSGVIRRLL